MFWSWLKLRLRLDNRGDARRKLGGPISRGAPVFYAIKSEVKFLFLSLAKTQLKQELSLKSIRSSNLSWNLSSGTQPNEEDDLEARKFTQPKQESLNLFRTGVQKFGRQKFSQILAPLNVDPPPNFCTSEKSQCDKCNVFRGGGVNHPETVNNRRRLWTWIQEPNDDENPLWHITHVTRSPCDTLSFSETQFRDRHLGHLHKTEQFELKKNPVVRNW